MRMIVGALVASALACAAPALAQTANFKCPAPGTRIEFSDGGQTTWTGQDGNSCRIRQKRPKAEERDLLWYAPAAATTPSNAKIWAEQLKPSTLWPLTVGKKISGLYDGPGTTRQSGRWTNTFTVEKFEKISTKAGTFDAFVVVWQQDGVTHYFKSTLRQWYAAGPGVIVKFDYNDTEGLTTNGEATSIKQ
jgi:hypothetical protein